MTAPKPHSSTSHRIASALALAGMLSACSVTPHPMSASNLDTRAAANRVAVTARQEPVTGPIDLYEAMARALKYNLDYRVGQMQQELKDRELKISSYRPRPKRTSCRAT